MPEAGGITAPSLAHRIIANADRNPDAPALWFGGEELSFADLLNRASVLVARLEEADVAAGDRAIICLRRSPELVIAVTACILKRVTFMLIPPDDPPARVALQLEDGAPSAIFAEHESVERFNLPRDKVIDLSRLTETTTGNRSFDFAGEPDEPDRLIYMAYTSGSTGKPKATMNQESALRAFLAYCDLTMPSGPGDRILQRTSIGFDPAIVELVWPLTNGVCIVLPPPDMDRDTEALAQLMAAEKITLAILVPTLLRDLLAVEDSPAMPHLRRLIVLGEVLPMDLARRGARRFSIPIENLYGPAECTVGVNSWVVDPSFPGDIAPIGPPYPGTTTTIVDENLRPVADGTRGEILIGGEQVCLGYWQREELTAERFVKGPLPGIPGDRFYRTGDVGMVLPDGNLICYGRKDAQTKINGVRVELGEVEAALEASPEVEVSAVATFESAAGTGKQLIAYVEGSRDTPPPTAEGLRTALAERLAAAVIPSRFMIMPALPRLPNGKINRKALPSIEDERLGMTSDYQAPTDEIERIIAEIWSQMLSGVKVGVADSFFELGGTSVQAARMVARINQRFGTRLNVTVAFTDRTPERLARRIADAAPASQPSTAIVEPLPPEADTNLRGVAIIAMAGRFPGAGSVETFWDNLLAGHDGMTRFSTEELEDRPEVTSLPNYVPVRGIVEGADRFDAQYYGMTPRDAAMIDPQQRLLLDCAAEALDSAGYLVEPEGCAIGTFLGVGETYYWHHNVLPEAQRQGTDGTLPIAVANEKDYAATRIAHRLNLTGPAVTVQTACSTSLTSIGSAVDAIRLGRCEMALAGGLSLRSPQRVGHLYQEGAMFTEDGTCRPFDAEAKGTLFNDGGGVVLLKSLAAAERDGDQVLAVISGVGLSNDGADKASFTAPSVGGQTAAVSAALKDAGITGDQVGFVEAHGTGTPLGDPIEIEALADAYGLAERRSPPLRLGSVKSNVGHMVAGAGVAGLIKATLAVRTGRIPGTLHFRSLNPAIAPHAGSLSVDASEQEWPSGPGPRRAGITSLGVGGTNVHVIIEQAPDSSLPSPTALPVLTASAPSVEGLQSLSAALAERLTKTPDSLPDLLIAQHRRRAESRRISLSAPDAETLVTRLEQVAAGGVPVTQTPGRPGRLAFLFTGQGSQYFGMAAPLVEQFPTVRQAVDDGLAALPFNADPVRHRLFELPDGDRAYPETEFAQPALVILERAMAMLAMEAGLRPALLLGHSLGEMVAAHLAGVMSLEGLMKAVAERARLMSELEPGRLMAVRGTEVEIRPHLNEAVSIAAINGADQVVIAGAVDAVEAVGAKLDAAGLAGTVLATSHAFHSPLVDPATQPFTDVMRGISLSAPKLEVLSSVTGVSLTAAEATDPAYWGGHIRRTVQFHRALNSLADAGMTDAVELGPKAVLTKMAKRTLKGRVTVGAALGHKEGGEIAGLADTLGNLWCAGHPVNWSSVEHHGIRRPPLSLPMGRRPTRCWIDPPSEGWIAASAASEEVVAVPVTEPEKASHPAPPPKPDAASLASEVVAILEDLSGIAPAPHEMDISFLEFGLDSLILTQLGLAVRKKWGVALSQRVLATEITSPALLVAKLEAEGAKPPAPPPEPAAPPSLSVPDLPPTAPKPVAPAQTAPQRFGAQAKITRTVDRGLTERQRAHIAELIRWTNARTPKAKAEADKHRPHLADPRTVAGFNPLWKEMVYPVVVHRSDGAEMWDIDGNRYVDMFGGFGANILGHRHREVEAAIREQLSYGIELGPQNPLTGRFAKRVSNMVGLERVAFCTTGSEAVAGAVRAGRTATGRDLIVTFNKSYHGIFDEVIVRGGAGGKGRPGAPGIPDGKVGDVLVLDYDDPVSLDRLRAMADQVAVVLVEPVQSRGLDLRPRSFLQELRGITERAGAALLFDEIITGFRVAPGGAQEYFGINADIATYGKILGGGLPGAAIAGKPWVMDALDGGEWRYGDDSRPEAGLTYFAGTMVRHPLAMAAGNAVLEVLEREGPAFQQRLTERTTQVVDAFRTAVAHYGAPFIVPHFSSAFRVETTPGSSLADLLFYHLRARGVFIQEDRTWFLTAAHEDAHLEQVVIAFRDGLDAMARGGLFEAPLATTAELPPVPGAVLGRDPSGRAIWVVSDGRGGWRPVPDLPHDGLSRMKERDNG